MTPKDQNRTNEDREQNRDDRDQNRGTTGSQHSQSTGQGGQGGQQRGDQQRQVPNREENPSETDREGKGRQSDDSSRREA